MKTLATGANNDLYLGPSGQLALSSDLEAVSQTCEHVVKTMMGELILQTDQGIPNFQMIWNGAPNLAQAENALREALLGVKGVLAVPQLSAFVENHVLIYNATIETIYGEAALGL